jgi:SAM-dependent methyltransferase
MQEESIEKRLRIADSEISRILEGRVVESFDVNDPHWQKICAEAIGSRPASWRRILGRRLKAGGRNGREQLEVRKTYDQHYGATSAVADWLVELDKRSLVAQWRDKGFVLTPGALRLAHLLYIARAIEVLRPASVLEVGCGNGNMLFSLSAMFPEVKFSGVELSAAGVALAVKAQEQGALPASFAAAFTAPVLDPMAHLRVSVQVADARMLPFADRSIDLVYTRLALEQMEQIRPQVIDQIARVANRAVALVEPWRDFNRADPGRAYIRRMGYFNGEARELEKNGFSPVLVTDDIPQKVQFSAGPVIALRR